MTFYCLIKSLYFMFEQILSCLNIQHQARCNTGVRVNVNSFVTHLTRWCYPVHEGQDRQPNSYTEDKQDFHCCGLLT